MMMFKILSSLVVLQLATTHLIAADPMAAKPVNLEFGDQFGNSPDLASQRGKVVVLVYGDRKGTDACKQLGERLHTSFHPTARGLKPADAQTQPVIALPNLKPGQVSPEVLVMPVACCGKVPGLVQTVIRNQIKSASPEVPVWLDFANTMTTAFGMTTGETNVVVFDTQGRYRVGYRGTMSQTQLQEMVQQIQNYRAEALSK